MKSSARRYIHSMARANDHVFMDHTSTTEIDNHADTCCFGRNFLPLYFTGQVCEVQPFLEEYESVHDVEVCSAATAFDDPETGSTVILVFNQGLWFGPKMSHSLINPNQCRSFGISLCDDPFDPYRKLSIYDPHTDTTIPLAMRGTICTFVSRVPTQDELANCPHVTLTSDLPWNPSSLEFLLPSPEEEERKVSGASTQQVFESDFILSQISPALVTTALLPRLISSVQVKHHLAAIDTKA